MGSMNLLLLQNWEHAEKIERSEEVQRSGKVCVRCAGGRRVGCDIIGEQVSGIEGCDRIG